jgi:ribonucleotide monophosphatase NagD (HAD superfamily)
LTVEQRAIAALCHDLLSIAEVSARLHLPLGVVRVLVGDMADEHLDTGGWVRLLEYATGQTARVLGKPSPEFFTAPLAALGRGPQTALVVGDDLAADIGGGQAVGAAAVLVGSGKGDRPQPGAQAEPDAVVDSVAELPGLLGG